MSRIAIDVLYIKTDFNRTTTLIRAARKVKVTFVSLYSDVPVGGAKTIFEYANQLSALGHQVTVIEFPAKSKSSGGTAPRWHCLDERVNLICSDYLSPEIFPDADAIVGYLDDMPPEKGIRFGLIQGYGVYEESIEKANFRAPLKKICVSKWLVEKGLELGVSADELVYIPNGIDPEKYRILTPIESRHPRIAMHYVHNELRKIKGGEDGIQALEIVHRRYQNLEFLLFGTRPRPAHLPEWLKYERNPAQETLVRSILNKSSIFVCPSWVEGFGLTSAEAMACGCALATTDTGGSRVYAEHDVTALVSPPRRPELLADNILRLLNDDPLRIKLARAGHERIRQFSWERSAVALEQLIINELSRKSRLEGETSYRNFTRR